MNSQTVDAKDPKDYYTAMETVLTLLGVGVSKINHPAAKAVGAALPVIGKIAPKVAPVAAPLAGKIKEHAPAAMSAVRDRAAEVASNAGSKAAEAVGSIGGVGQRVKDSRSKKDAEKARATARHALLGTADPKMSLADFVQRRATQAQVEGVGEFLAYPGAYAVLHFNKKLKRDSYENYDDIYVHASANIGASIMDDIEGRGNADIYADYKYGQDLHLLVFPCAEDDMDELAANIMVALDADCSYNALSTN